MTLIPGNIEVLAAAYQVDKSTPADDPTIAWVITDEALDPGEQKTPLPETDASAQLPSLVVVGAQPGGTVKKWVRPNEEDFFLYGLLGKNTDGGLTPNFTHTATVDPDAPFDTPYLTLWQIWPGSLVVKYSGVRIGQAVFSSTPGNGWEVEYTFLGLEAVFADVEDAPDLDGLFVDEQPHTWPEYQTTLGVDTPGTVNSMSLTINRNTNRFQGDIPGFKSFDLPNGLFGLTGSFQLAFEDDEIIRAAHTGAVDGTALTTEIFDEALELDLTRDPDTGINFAMAGVQFSSTKLAVHTDGAVAVLDVDYQAKKQADITDAITSLVKNQMEKADRT